MKNKKNVAEQTYHFGKENRFKENICEDIHNDCISCGEDIQHPICPNCLAKAFSTWTRKFPEHKQLKAKLNPLMKHHNHTNAKSKPCVVCASPVHICPLCFTTHLYSLVKEAGLGVLASTEFLFMFNFDFKHNGYYQELEAYGGY
ncbi:MAG: hypothetical protein V1888_04145 [archaeon]